MARYRIVHTGQPPGAPFTEERRALAEAGVDAEIVSYGKCATPARVIEAARDADVVVIGSEPFPAEVVAALPKARALIRYGVGFDTIDVDAATAHGVLVCTIPAPDFCADELSSHVMAFLLACARKLVPLDRAVRAGVWREGATRAMTLAAGGVAGETLGVVGLGNLGRATARKALALGFNVIAFDPYVEKEATAALGVEPVSLADLLRRSDYVSIHAPLNRETYHLIDAAALAQMKPTAYLINTARGPLVDEAALVEALRSGTIAGAGLDTFEAGEPLPEDSPLLDLDNVLLTPHSAAFSYRSMPTLQRRVGEEAVKVLRCVRPASVVNPAVLERPNRLTWGM
jgi:D-3-phosphoglycerate dehydrogenase